MIADDFTGALDTGICFASHNTRVMSLSGLSRLPDCDVLVISAETRHLPPKKAYDIVFNTVKLALDNGFTHIYKKTDSALRGNIGSELAAVIDASGLSSLPFIPAFPKMNRTVKGGTVFIDGVPVSESAFGKDPRNPVRHSAVSDIIAETSDVSCSLHGGGDLSGISVYDASADDELMKIARALGKDGLHISAGCAGFASALVNILSLPESEVPSLTLPQRLLCICGSKNPATLRQIQNAREHGFSHIRLSPSEKLGNAESSPFDTGTAIKLFDAGGMCIIDANDPVNCHDTEIHAEKLGLSAEDISSRICDNLAAITEALLDKGPDTVLLCTGGDTLSAFLNRIGVNVLVPVCELFPGVVLTSFDYAGKNIPLISKSGGFGEHDLFCRLFELIANFNQ